VNEPIRSWIPVPGWWVPVWVVLDDVGGTTDVLEEAVAGMVRAGLDTTPEITRELCVDAALVESAVATLIGAAVLAVDGGRLVAVQGRPEAHVRSRAGFVAWSPSAGRALLQIWLDTDAPEVESAPTGWRVETWEEPEEGYPRAPRRTDVAQQLELLPTAGDLRVFEPRAGAGVHETDGGRVCRLRPRPGPYRRQPIWVAVEQRPQGPVVWRPTLVPQPTIDTELDPGGWDGLIASAHGAARTGAEGARHECMDAIAPGVLREAGFSSVQELRDSARAQAARELGDLGAWEGLPAVVEEAFVVQKLGEVVGVDWRRLVQAWGHVLEVLTQALVNRLRDRLRALQAREIGVDERRQLQKLFGTQTWRAERAVARLGTLKEAVANGVDTIGTRVAALAVCVALDPDVRRAYQIACGGTPALFEALDKAVDERNRATHPRDDAEEIEVTGHRARVLYLCRTLTTFEVPSSPSR
jgi:hypothetical protein